MPGHSQYLRQRVEGKNYFEVQYTVLRSSTITEGVGAVWGVLETCPVNNPCPWGASERAERWEAANEVLERLNNAGSMPAGCRGEHQLVVGTLGDPEGLEEKG